MYVDSWSDVDKEDNDDDEDDAVKEEGEGDNREALTGQGEDDKTLKDFFSLEETPSIRSSADCCSTFRLRIDSKYSFVLQECFQNNYLLCMIISIYQMEILLYFVSYL